MTFETVAGLFFSVVFFSWLIPDDATWPAMLIPLFWFGVVMVAYYLSGQLTESFADRGGFWMDRTKSLNELLSPRRLTNGDAPGAAQLDTNRSQPLAPGISERVV